MTPPDVDPLDLRLWALVRGDQRAEARTRRHPRGLELVILINGVAQASHVFTPDRLEGLDALAATLERGFEAAGWTPAGPQP